MIVEEKTEEEASTTGVKYMSKEQTIRWYEFDRKFWEQDEILEVKCRHLCDYLEVLEKWIETKVLTEEEVKDKVKEEAKRRDLSMKKMVEIMKCDDRYFPNAFITKITGLSDDEIRLV